VDRQENIVLTAVVVLNHLEYLLGETSWHSLKPLQNKAIASGPGTSGYILGPGSTREIATFTSCHLRPHRPHRPIDYRGIMSQQQFGPTFDPEPIPPVLAFRLPDGTPVESSQASTADGPIEIELGGESLCSFVPQSRTLRVSPHGIVNSERAESAPVSKLILAHNRVTISRDDLWGALYGLWLRKAEDDVTPFELSDNIEDAAELRGYLSTLSD